MKEFMKEFRDCIKKQKDMMESKKNRRSRRMDSSKKRKVKIKKESRKDNR